MRLVSPSLNIDEIATLELIENTLNSINEQIDSFAVLAKDDMNYVQTLNTENGFIVQFQNGSIEEHYEFETYLSRPQTLKLFKAYFCREVHWSGNLSYSKVELRGFWGKLGLVLGRFTGSIARVLRNRGS